MASTSNNTSGKEKVSEEAFRELKGRCQPLFEGDPSQAHSDASLLRYLRAFRDVDSAFVALLKYNKWRREYGVDSLSPNDPDIQSEMATGKIRLLPHRDLKGRPLLYIAARKHNAYDRDIDKITKFIVYMLELVCKKCDEDVIDNLCIVFDLKEFSMGNMDYQFVKNLIWLLSKYYPERLGVCLIINAPMIFYGCWPVIKPLLNEVTASKVTFVNSDQLIEYMHPDIIPQD